METYLFKKKLYYILNRNLGEINLVQKMSLESKILKFPSEKETGKTAILCVNLQEGNYITLKKDKITTTIDSQSISILIHGGFYKIKNKKSSIIILDGMRTNLAYN